jgi:hypothetical protein
MTFYDALLERMPQEARRAAPAGSCLAFGYLVRPKR